MYIDMYVCMYAYIYIHIFILDSRWGAKAPHLARVVAGWNMNCSVGPYPYVIFHIPFFPVHFRSPDFIIHISYFIVRIAYSIFHISYFIVHIP